MGILATFREVFGLIGLKSISISELAKNRPPFVKSEGYTSGFYFCLNGGFSLQNLRWFCSVSVT